MQEENYDHQELVCVKVDKVYDWIMRESTFDIFPGGTISFPGVTATTDLTNATVECEVTPAATNPVEILHREDRKLCIDGMDVCLQQLTIRKNFSMTIIVTSATGQIYRSAIISNAQNEKVTLCAPEGTDVEITFTELTCFVTSTGSLIAGVGTITFAGLTTSVTTCQSIQSTYPATLEIFAGFCEPREDFAVGCGTPVHPPQCPHLFPDNKHCHHKC